MKSSAVFEQEARRVARELFPSGGGYGPVILDGRERDGVINDGETIHIIEATTNPQKRKANQDLEKSVQLKRELQRVYGGFNYRIWFITEKDPTPDQTAEADAARKKARCPVAALSLSAFSQRLIDVPAYLAARENYPFGSVRNPDPAAPTKRVDERQFIPIDLIDADSHAPVSPQRLAEGFQSAPGIYLLLGDFGAGKSMTMRHIFYLLRNNHREGKSVNFPVFLNLRDHVGQDEPSSALFDHGTRIGFSNPERLVRAWNAGFVHLFLDGFDEIASSRFRASGQGLRAVRRRAMTLVRKFVEQHSTDQTSLLISGRANYFGTANERTQAIGMATRNVTTYTLNEFSLEQVQEYLRRLGLDQSDIPDWLPSRPLLLGYLAVKNVLQDNRGRLSAMSRAEGWDYVLDQICVREGGQIEDLGGQTDRVRLFVDRLATRARATTTGLGPISAQEMTDIFREVFPASPDEAAQQLLLRMAGLTASMANSGGVVAVPPDQEDAREFVDGDLVDAARAGDVARFVKYMYDEQLNRLFSDRNCVTIMGDLGVEVAARKLVPLSTGQARAALQHAAEQIEAPSLALDITNIIQNSLLSCPTGDKSNRDIVLKNGYFTQFEFSPEVDLSGIVLRECIVDNIYIDRKGSKISGPRMEACLIQQIFGAISRADLPDSIFDANCEIETFRADVEDETDIRIQPLAEPVRVLLVTLRKLFVQPGRGRKENAFPRGLDDRERVYVADILSLIARNDFAHPQRLGGPPVWIPNRTKAKDALSMLLAPQQSTHPLIVAARNL